MSSALDNHYGVGGAGGDTPIAGPDPYDPNGDFQEIINYIKSVIESHAGKWRGGNIGDSVSMWMLMYFVSLMSNFTSDSVGSTGYIDKDINMIKNLSSKINEDLNAGRSTTYQVINGHKYYYCVINGQKYWLDPQTPNPSGGGTVPMDQTLDYKIVGDIAAVVKATQDDPYFKQHPELVSQITTRLQDFEGQISGSGINGNLHLLWEKVDPQIFGGTGQGDPTLMQPLMQDMESVQKQYEAGDSVQQAIIKSQTSLYNTEVTFQTNICKALNKMIGLMVQAFIRNG